MQWANPWALWFLPPVLILVTWLHWRGQSRQRLVMFSAVRLLIPENHVAQRRHRKLRHWLLYLLRLTTLTLIVTAFAQPNWNDADIPAAMQQPSAPASIDRLQTSSSDASFDGDVIVMTQHTNDSSASWQPGAPAHAIDRVLALLAAHADFRYDMVTPLGLSQVHLAHINPPLLIIVEPGRLHPSTVSVLADRLKHGTNVLYLATESDDADNLNRLLKAVNDPLHKSIHFIATQPNTDAQRLIVNRMVPFAAYRHHDWIELIESVRAKPGVIAISPASDDSYQSIIVSDNGPPVLYETMIASGRLMILNIDGHDSRWLKHPAWLPLISECVNDLTHRPIADQVHFAHTPAPSTNTSQRSTESTQPWVILIVAALTCVCIESLLTRLYATN